MRIVCGARPSPRKVGEAAAAGSGRARMVVCMRSGDWIWSVGLSGWRVCATRLEFEFSDGVHVDDAEHCGRPVRAARCPHVQPPRVASVEQQRCVALALLAERADAVEAVLGGDLGAGLRMREQTQQVALQVTVPRLDPARRDQQDGRVPGHVARERKRRRKKKMLQNATYSPILFIKNQTGDVPQTVVLVCVPCPWLVSFPRSFLYSTTDRHKTHRHPTYIVCSNMFKRRYQVLVLE